MMRSTHFVIVASLCVACSDDGGASAQTDTGGTAAADDGDSDSAEGPDDGLDDDTSAGSDGPEGDSDAGSSTGDGALPPVGVPAGGIALDAIEVNQGVGIALAESGVAVAEGERVAPIIGGRSALVRASYQLEPGFAARTIDGRLWLRNGDDDVVLIDTRTIAGPADWDSFDGTFHWVVDAEALTDQTELAIELVEARGVDASVGEPAGARFPSDGFTPLQAWGDPMTLEIMLVPFTCAGFEDLDLSRDNLADLEGFLFNTFPVQDVTLTVRDPVASSNCSEFDAAENDLPALRELDGAEPWVYYGGLLPGNGGGYSISIEGGDQMDYRRTFASHTWRDFGLTFDLYAHELGHNHGRDHTFNDPGYPGEVGGQCGAISTYGWGATSALMPSSGWSNDLKLGLDWFDPHEALLVPTSASCSGEPEGNRWNFNDMMSYTYPYWVSAYTYAAAADRIRLVSGWAAAGAVHEPEGKTLRIMFGPEGDIHRAIDRGGWPVRAVAAWAQCGARRLPVRRVRSVGERRTPEGVITDVYTAYELPLPADVPATDCVVELDGRTMAFVAP